MTTININLLPEELRARPSGGAIGGVNLPEKDVLVPIGAGAIAALLILMLPGLVTTYYLDPRDQAADQAQSEIEAEINKYNTTLKSLKAIADNKEMLRQQLATLQTVAGGRTPIADQLNELRALTPANLWFDSLKNDTATGKLTLSGSALDYQSVAFFHRNLQHSSYFADPVLSRTEAKEGGKDGPSVVSFAMTLSVRPAPLKQN
jgi:Tfp pilus assembly protein PilN